MNIFEAKRYLRKKGYRIIKENAVDTPFHVQGWPPFEPGEGCTVDIWVPADHELYDAVMEHLEGFGDVDQDYTVEDQRDDSDFNGKKKDLRMTVQFSGDKPAYRNKNRAREIVCDWLSQFDWRSYGY